MGMGTWWPIKMIKRNENCSRTGMAKKIEYNAYKGLPIATEKTGKFFLLKIKERHYNHKNTII